MTGVTTGKKMVGAKMGDFIKVVRGFAPVTPRQIDYWTRMGYLCPLTPKGQGSGRHRLYTITDLPMAVTLARLSADLGGFLTRKTMERVVEAVRDGRSRIELENGLTITWPAVNTSRFGIVWAFYSEANR